MDERSKALFAEHFAGLIVWFPYPIRPDQKDLSPG
jgi:hypothetical protein